VEIKGEGITLPRQGGALRVIVEQTYAARKAAGTYRGCVADNDPRDVLARGDLDAVLIATGDRRLGRAMRGTWSL
jgi:hypothetical protein